MAEYVLYERVKKLCDERGITINRLETELGFSACSIQKWKTPGTPKVDRIAAVANYFGVSIDYLIGKSDIRTVADEMAGGSDYAVLQRAMERMTVEDKDKVMMMLKAGFDYAFSDSSASGKSGKK